MNRVNGDDQGEPGLETMSISPNSTETRELGLQVQPRSEAARPLRLVLHLLRPAVVRPRRREASNSRQILQTYQAHIACSTEQSLTNKRF